MITREVDQMARPVDESKYRAADEVTRSRPRRLESMITADEERNKRVDSIRLRVPVGWREIIQDYVVTLPEYQITNKKNPNVTPRPNVNKWLVDLIRENLPEDIAEMLPDSAADDKINN